MQLQITNLSKSAVLFPTFNTFGIRLFSPNGKELKPRGPQKGTIATRPVLLPGGAAFALCRRAEVVWDEKGETFNLHYFDGTGSQSIFGPLESGSYQLVFWYTVSPQQQEKPKSSVAPAWVGHVVTEGVSVQVDKAPAPGRGALNYLVPRASSEPLRIRESKPVTVNDAQFVVAAQTNWALEKIKNVPVEIQLRITNLSKNDVLFPTFDTFNARLSHEDGTKIVNDGGRMGATILTRPIILSAGATFTLGTERGRTFGFGYSRHGELYWNEATGKTELIYYNGTGWYDVFGPLKPGRFHLDFGYGVSELGPLKTHRATGTWLGTAITDKLVIEVLDN
jgi:hypothetical protein